MTRTGRASPRLRRRVLVTAAVGGLLLALASLAIPVMYAGYDVGEEWGAWTNVRTQFERFAFEEAYSAHESDGAWSAGLDAVDPGALSAEVGVKQADWWSWPAPARYCLVVDERSRIAALFEPRAPNAVLLADGRTADVWDRGFVRDLREAGDDLACLADDPRVEWRSIERDG